jgi:c-di-GMP-binding flagellar brake protein YcgR
MVNLRRYARLKTEISLNYRVIGVAKARKVRTKSVNISIGGVCFETPDKHKVSERLELEVFLNPDDPVKVEGTVIWQKKFEDGTHRAGVKFDGLSNGDKKRFSDFIFNKMYEMTGMGNRAGLVRYAKEHGWEEYE